MFDRISRSIRRVIAGVAEKASKLGAAITSPIERAFAATFGAALHMLESFERVEDWLLALVRLLTWPFRMLWRLAMRAIAFVVPVALLESLVARIRRAFAFVGMGVWRLIERLDLDGPVRKLVWLLQPIWRPIAAVGGFFYAWLATRHFRELLWGLPAIILLLPILGAATWGAWWGSAQATERYNVALRDAVEAKDYTRVELYERKLLQLGADTRRTDYQTAEALAKEGKLQEAYERMQRLAPEDHAGYAPAHAWIMQHLLSQQLKVPEEERLRLSGRHLEHLKLLGVRGDQIDFLRAIWLAQSQRLTEASTMFSPLINKMPYAAMERLRIDVMLNDNAEARRDAFAVRTHMQDAKRRKLPIDAQQYQAWAAAEEMLGDAASLGTVVREWHTTAPDDPAARRNMALVDVQEFNEMIRQPNADPRELADRIVEMVQLADNTSQYQPQLAFLFAHRKQVPICAALIDELIRDPKTPLTVIDALGTAAALQGEIELSRTLLKRVLDKKPDQAVAWNNYAWALTQQPNPDLETALVAVNHALQIMPNEFRFRETRGQVFVQLGKWQEAVTDLEVALNGMPEARAVHASLAKAYEALGQTELARMHREQAQ